MYYIIQPSVTVLSSRGAISNQTIRPDPIDMLHCAPILL